LLRWFPDEAACAAYLERLRWPEGPVCAACGGRAFWRMGDRALRCTACRREQRLLAGSVFDRSKIDLETWFAAAWYVTNQKGGVSALGLQRALGLGSYRTAWTLLHKLRRAMVRPDRELLRDLIELDETYLGTPTRGGKRGRGAVKTIVLIAVELSDTYKPRRVRLERIPDLSGPIALDFAKRVIAPGATIHTDGLSVYPILAEHGYQHWATPIAQTGDDAQIAMPAVHRVASLLKRWLLGTHQGAVRANQLDAYLAEFAFRFNRRRSGHVGLLFHRLLENAIVHDPEPYTQIRGGPISPHSH
jgi:ISXO2-like transposase domain/Transposase zinc-ribbon domain